MIHETELDLLVKVQSKYKQDYVKFYYLFQVCTKRQITKLETNNHTQHMLIASRNDKLMLLRKAIAGVGDNLSQKISVK